MNDTIYALSSGAPPAAIGVIRISGPRAGSVLETLAGGLPDPRRAVLRELRDAKGGALDRALALWFPGPATATGEDLAELHCHGGRAVVAAIQATLGAMEGLRRAAPGEFTRRAFANGVIDLAEAEGLADLLSSETELQRLAVQRTAGGGLSRQVEAWRERLLGLSAQVEAALDFADEDDVDDLPGVFHVELDTLVTEWVEACNKPRVERLREGVRVVLGGPPNSGKSSLFNALLDEGAAIVSAEAGTTRDVIERPIALDGVPLVLVDTAGLREKGMGEIERIGIDRARGEVARADIVLWLGPEGEGPSNAVEIAARSDLPGTGKAGAVHAVSSVTGEGVETLAHDIAARARAVLPRPGDTALNARQAGALEEAAEALRTRERSGDLLLLAERLRIARLALDRLLGRHSTEDMLDALFGRFCIGK